MKLKENYIAANCCAPGPGIPLTGYFSHDGVIKVHASSCPNLAKADPERLMVLEWHQIVAEEEFTPDEDYDLLDAIDFELLRHHEIYGYDYSLKVARMVNRDREAVFDSHTRLRELGLLTRVEPKMIQYRKNIVPGKWIKHRNHTYYDITDKGKKYLEYHEGKKGD